MENGRNHLLDILKLIDSLQKKSIIFDSNDTCSRPILGQNNNLIYNTRPISFYLCDGSALSINSVSGTATTLFRIENIDNNAVTVRLLNTSETGEIESTNEFATININCIAAIMCSNDISLIL